ncbi:hypothetical protein KSD_31310 [Ktedonobacter sp. SOSP1-85]|uniref:hypothetical protein n=1 Tax=Ktedonobacter sp. SOSP1-85 TaxID=2778367 RepID=UPI0019157801|nr:hypothetical protein [Ktedonobacter sp. SOSP1-85]GHO75360.1 hypothetical protein KSD_31310 [Ktedonobacter sp. SOSP1-85]
MLNKYERERVGSTFSLEKKSIYQIAKEEGDSHQTIEKALFDPYPKPYHLFHPTPAPVVGPYQPRREALLNQHEHMPRKQLCTAHGANRAGIPQWEKRGASNDNGQSPRCDLFASTPDHRVLLPVPARWLSDTDPPL